MRILVNQRNKRKIEKDLRVAKCDYGFRPYYSIKDAILEKWLMYDNSLLNEKYTMHNIIDLKSCYNR